MNYYVRTTGQRKLDSSYSQIPYKLLIDKEHKPVDHFIECLFNISNEDSLLMEDDLILCKDFEIEVGKVVNLYPGRIINFFQSPRRPYPILDSSSIIFNQCTYYPKGIGTKIAEIMKTLPRRSGHDKNKYSYLESMALQKLNLTAIIYRPHLVQHLDLDTLLFEEETTHWRRSLFFIDYLKELNISYDEVNDHIDELTSIMNKHFSNIKITDYLL